MAERYQSATNLPFENACITSEVSHEVLSVGDVGDVPRSGLGVLIVDDDGKLVGGAVEAGKHACDVLDQVACEIDLCGAISEIGSVSLKWIR